MGSFSEESFAEMRKFVDESTGILDLSLGPDQLFAYRRFVALDGSVADIKIYRTTAAEIAMKREKDHATGKSS